jgi:hypothetical protein
VNGYDVYKMQEREVIQKAEQHRIVAEAAPIRRQPNRTLAKMGKLLVEVGTHLVEQHSTSDDVPSVIHPKPARYGA